MQREPASDVKQTSKEQTDMNKKFILALMLASGLAFAQSSGSSPGSSDQQQPSAQQTQPPSGQTTSPASAGQSSLTGCLKGSDSGWVLVAEGQSTPIKGDSSTLGPHNGHQVQVKGSQASDGSFTVTDVVMIADTCTRQQASAAGAGVALTNVSYAGQASQNPPSDTANPPQTAPSSTQSTAPQSTTPPASTAPDTTTPQSTGTTPQSTTPPTTGTTPSTSTDQNPAASHGGHQKLPQSASPLPLLGLLGLGSLATGLFARRKK
jgi:hypothetical protein